MSTEPTADALIPPPRLLTSPGSTSVRTAPAIAAPTGCAASFASATSATRATSPPATWAAFSNTSPTPKWRTVALPRRSPHRFHVSLPQRPRPGCRRLAHAEPPRLLDRLRHAGRVRRFFPRTEDCCAEWVERFIRFHGATATPASATDQGRLAARRNRLLAHRAGIRSSLLAAASRSMADQQRQPWHAANWQSRPALAGRIEQTSTCGRRRCVPRAKSWHPRLRRTAAATAVPFRGGLSTPGATGLVRPPIARLLFTMPPPPRKPPCPAAPSQSATSTAARRPSPPCSTRSSRRQRTRSSRWATTSTGGPTAGA